MYNVQTQVAFDLHTQRSGFSGKDISIQQDQLTFSLIVGDQKLHTREKAEFRMRLCSVWHFFRLEIVAEIKIRKINSQRC